MPLRPPSLGRSELLFVGAERNWVVGGHNDAIDHPRYAYLKSRSSRFSRGTVICYRVSVSIGAGTKSLIALWEEAQGGSSMVDMRRREFIGLLGGAAAMQALAAQAQQPKIPTIGALVIGNINPEQFWREFRQGLRDLGYVEGQNIRFEFRSAEGHLERLAELANELVRLKVDIIVTWFTPTAVAAKRATHEIPIVMAETGDPIGTGLVASLPRPGGNVTGIASVTAELAGKSVQLIRDMLPRARRVTALANATDPFSKPFLEQIKLGGEATGTTINPVRISSSELETAFASMEKDRPDAVIVQPSLPSRRAAELALKHHI